MIKFSEKAVAMITTGMLVATIALTGCGGSKPETQSTTATETQTTQTEAPKAEETKTDAAATTNTTEAAPAQTQQQSAPQQQSASSYIGDAAAIQAALAHSGFSEADVYDLDCELDLDDAVVHYDVDFKNGNMEYDYDIDATTGEVISYHSEIDD